MASNKPYIKIPTWDKGVWSYTVFHTKEEYRDYLLSLFKEPGKYEFDETVQQFNACARQFQKTKLYCTAPEGSRDFQTYWDTEKEKCRKGVIFRNNGKEWYLTRGYYMWINYLPIYDKLKNKIDFPRIWDSQYHTFLYLALAQLHDKHAVMMKKRQWGGTFLHIANIINRFWFEEGFTIKIGASLKDYINEKGAWKFLNQYRDFLNKNTAWYRPLDPEKTFSWQQRLKVRENNRDSYEGLKSTINGTSFEKDATAGVGGNISLFYHEEAGIAPKMNQTYEFMRPALATGGVLTGQFIASGSVGDLDQCKPLREFMENPDKNGFYGIETDLVDEHGTRGIMGLFIPEQWSFESPDLNNPCIDDYGNSLVDRALEFIKKEREQWKKDLTADIYQLRISQKPINIREAFAIRKISMFPLRYTGPQTRRIEEKEYALEYVDLARTSDNNIVIAPSKRTPCVYPTKDVGIDKRGCVVIHERPMEGLKPLITYMASVDPVAKGISQYSDSLACVYIYKMPTEVLRKYKDGTSETYMEGGKLVAWWTGRYDDVNETNEEISKLVELYQAYTTCEFNQGSWVNYMIGKRRQKYLALKEDMVFDAEANIKQGTLHKYGWYKTNTVWGKLLEYGIDSLSTIDSEVLDETTGEVKEIHYGVERIPDIWLLKEMDEYDLKGNFDRIIAYCALMAFAELRLSTLRGLYKKQDKVVVQDSNLDREDIMPTFKVNNGPFRNLVGGQGRDPFSAFKRRSPFKHL